VKRTPTSSLHGVAFILRGNVGCGASRGGGGGLLVLLLLHGVRHAPAPRLREAGGEEPQAPDAEPEHAEGPEAPLPAERDEHGRRHAAQHQRLPHQPHRRVAHRRREQLDGVDQDEVERRDGREEGEQLGHHPRRRALRDGDAHEAEGARRRGERDHRGPPVHPADEGQRQDGRRQLGQRVVRDAQVQVGAQAADVERHAVVDHADAEAGRHDRRQPPEGPRPLPHRPHRGERAAGAGAVVRVHCARVQHGEAGRDAVAVERRDLLQRVHGVLLPPAHQQPPRRLLGEEVDQDGVAERRHGRPQVHVPPRRLAERVAERREGQEPDGEEEEASHAHRVAPPLPDELRGQDQRARAHHGAAEPGHKPQRGVRPHVRRERGEHAGDGHGHEGREEHLPAAEERVRERGEQEPTRQAAGEEGRRRERHESRAGALERPLRDHRRLGGAVPRPRARREPARRGRRRGRRAGRRGAGAAPLRLGVREHGDEHLLRVEGPGEGQQDGLEQLHDAGCADVILDGVIDGRRLGRLVARQERGGGGRVGHCHGGVCV
jgi:hypothetical protein